MSDGQIVLDQELVENYMRVKNVSEEVARQKLAENMTREASVDLRQQMTTLMAAFRKMSPQLTGVIQREIDYSTGIKELRNEIKGLQRQLDEVNNRLTFERETYAKSMQLLNGIIGVDAETMARIAKLEASSVPLYKRMWNRVKCLLNN